MIHEVLLALSGHPSPLFGDSKGPEVREDVSLDDTELLSPSEKALLQNIGKLSELHRKLRQHLEQISSHHSSTICRAVATSIQQTHLARFQDKILAVESKILTKDTTIVGAYDIVPLAGVVGQFDDWHRPIAWYWDIACFVQPVETDSLGSEKCTGPALIDRLRAEQQTGFPDIEQAAIELSKVAEIAWLRQLASWVLYGKLPAFGFEDFFIQSRLEDEDHVHFVREKALLPRFVTLSTASSILFIGKSLHQVRKYGRQAGSSNGVSNKTISDVELASAHLRYLSSLPLPINSAQLSRAISGVKLSLSQNVLKTLLPMEMTLELLSCLKQFFLLSRSDFAMALIHEADSRLQVRQQSMSRLLQQDPVKALQGLTIKDAEFHQTLSQTWKTLASRDDDVDDEILDFARKHISLSTPADHESRPSTSDSVNGATPTITPIAFNDLLFPSAASLGLTITPPLDLFISQKELEVYSATNAYLLSIRRARSRLSDLWRQTHARRYQSSTPKYSTAGDGARAELRERLLRRQVAARKIWATCSAAIFLLSETSAYFEGEIVRESWDHFEDWVRRPASDDTRATLEMPRSTTPTAAVSQQDPETLASGHRAFLASLIYALLLSDVPYTKELRALLGNVDNLIAFFNRLLEIRQKLDAEQDAGGETGYTRGEEQRISLELDRARKMVDSDLKSVVNRLRQLDHERIGSARYFNGAATEGGFQPWKGGGVDRLLMKLEFGRMVEDGFDIV